MSAVENEIPIDHPNMDEVQDKLQELEKEVLHIINTRELFEPLIYERYEECIQRVKSDPFGDIFESMYALDPELDVNETETFKKGLLEFNELILNDWKFVEDHIHESRFINSGKPTERHKALISTDVAIGTIISTKTDMEILGYSEHECEILQKLGIVILRLNKLENTLHRMGRIGKSHGFIDPEMGGKKNL
tara:strand:- start:7634 stop:8209 length:576 start_codon:yes stop_codon:yes gene_type:complete